MADALADQHRIACPSDDESLARMDQVSGYYPPEER